MRQKLNQVLCPCLVLIFCVYAHLCPVLALLSVCVVFWYILVLSRQEVFTPWWLGRLWESCPRPGTCHGQPQHEMSYFSQITTLACSIHHYLSSTVHIVSPALSFNSMENGKTYQKWNVNTILFLPQNYLLLPDMTSFVSFCRECSEKTREVARDV